MLPLPVKQTKLLARRSFKILINSLSESLWFLAKIHSRLYNVSKPSIIWLFDAIPWNKSTKVALESNFEKFKYHHVAFLGFLWIKQLKLWTLKWTLSFFNLCNSFSQLYGPLFRLNVSVQKFLLWRNIIWSFKTGNWIIQFEFHILSILPKRVSE